MLFINIDMELYKSINNEALSEDNKIKREVIERLKKQVQLYTTKEKEPLVLSDTILNNIERYIINFDDTLNKTLNDVYKKGEVKEDTGDLILNYNLLANYLDKIDFNLANVKDKQNVYNLLDEIAPKIGKILSLIKLKDYTDSDLVEKVYNNFKNRTYNVIFERERKQLEKESLSKQEKVIDITGENPKEKAIRRLENIVLKIGKIAEQVKLAKNSILLKAYNQAQTLLSAIRENKEDIGTVNKFLRDRERRVNEEYDKVFKPQVLDIPEEEPEEEANVSLM